MQFGLQINSVYVRVRWLLLAVFFKKGGSGTPVSVSPFAIMSTDGKLMRVPWLQSWILRGNMCADMRRHERKTVDIC